jgi:hypothetical protein
MKRNMKLKINDTVILDFKRGNLIGDIHSLRNLKDIAEPHEIEGISLVRLNKSNPMTNEWVIVPKHHRGVIAFINTHQIQKTNDRSNSVFKITKIAKSLKSCNIEPKYEYINKYIAPIGIEVGSIIVKPLSLIDQHIIAQKPIQIKEIKIDLYMMKILLKNLHNHVYETKYPVGSNDINGGGFTAFMGKPIDKNYSWLKTISIAKNYKSCWVEQVFATDDELIDKYDF